MRTLLQLIAFLAALWWGSSSSKISAAEPLFEGELLSVLTDRDESIMEQSEASEHAGLLGKTTLQAFYGQPEVVNGQLRQYSKTAQKFGFLANTPLVKFQGPGNIGIDAFVGYSWLGVRGNLLTPEGRQYVLSPEIIQNYQLYNTIDQDEHEFDIGMTIYSSVNSRFRPFVRVGLKYIHLGQTFTESNYNVTDGGIERFGTIATREYGEDYIFGIVSPGFETDLTDHMSYRLTCLLDLDNKIGVTAIQHDLVWWPYERFFLRGGMVNALWGDKLTFTLGGGVAF